MIQHSFIRLKLEFVEQCLAIRILVSVGVDAKRRQDVVAWNVIAADIMSDLVAV